MSTSAPPKSASVGGVKVANLDPRPAFGHAMRKFWCFDPDYINLNIGSYGAVPRPVIEACEALSREIEANPDLFHRITYLGGLDAVRERLARLVGAQKDDCVMVPNVSHGINTVLRNFEWNEGDVLIANNTTYSSILCTMQYISDAPPYPTLSTFTLTFPMSHADIVSRFREHLRVVKQQPPAGATHTDVLPKRKIVAVFDSIASNPGVRMPWEEMVRACIEEGVWSVVDAAHSLGHEVGINLSVVDPDFWVSNCHKWLYTKRSTALLYVAKRNQHMIRSSIPTSPYYVSQACANASTFLRQFECVSSVTRAGNGTTDYTHELSVIPALDFRAYLGGEEKINEYCHSLALAGGKRLAEVMGTRIMESVPVEGGKDELILNMVNVELPLPGHLKPTMEIDTMLKTGLLIKYKIYAVHFYHADRWWTRACAQVWNEIEDFEKLGLAFLALCEEIVSTQGIKDEHST